METYGGKEETARQVLDSLSHHLPRVNQHSRSAATNAHTEDSAYPRHWVDPETASTVSSSVPYSHASSIWDSHSGGTGYPYGHGGGGGGGAESTFTPSEAPSLRSAPNPAVYDDFFMPPLHNGASDGGGGGGGGGGEGVLPCEFHWYTGCRKTFRLSEREDWKEHVAQHLNYQYPLIFSCWWCDIWTFEAGGTDSASASFNYDQRMNHIHHHIIYDRYLWSHRRPDFHMLDHLWALGLVTAETFERERAIREAPDIEGVYPAEWRPAASERSKMVYCDVDKEDRGWKRQQRKKQEEQQKRRHRR